MRILHVIRSDGFGGVENYVARLSRVQRANGCDVVVIGGHPERMREALGTDDDRFVAARTTLEVTRAVRRELAFRSPDVVHAHMTAAEVGAIIALTGHGTPLIVTRHFAQPRGRQRWARLAARLLAKRISKQISVSEYVANAVEGDSVLVLSGVPQPVEPNTGQPRELSILVAQRLEPEKETADALAIFERSGIEQLGWRLIIAGDGSQRRALETKTQQLGLKDVEFLGHRTDIADLMARSSMLIATCPTEHYGLTVVEAMAHGLPVVAAGAAGHLETVGADADARLYPVGDLNSAAAMVRSLADDPDERRRYGAGLQRLQRDRFTMEEQAAATQQVYESVL